MSPRPLPFLLLAKSLPPSVANYECKSLLHLSSFSCFEWNSFLGKKYFFPLDFDTFFLGKSVSNFCEGFCCFAVSLTLVCFESCYYALDLFFLSKCKYIYSFFFN